MPANGSPRNSAVTVDSISVRYGGQAEGTLALNDLSLSIEQNRVTGVVGPSGCGKTTLLYLLAGLTTPTFGKIQWSHHTAGVHPLSMVFQKDTLLPWLTTRENVGLHFRFRRTPRAHERETVDHLLRLVGLEAFADHYPYQLSGGMRRRVALLAGVAPNPAALLLDEPFSSLDEPTRVAVHQDVLRIVRDSSMTVVLVTHDLAEAITLCDEILIMSARPGRVVACHDVPFGRERNVLELRQTPAFLSLYGTLWHELSQEIKRATEPGPSAVSGGSDLGEQRSS